MFSSLLAQLDDIWSSEGLVLAELRGLTYSSGKINLIKHGIFRSAFVRRKDVLRCHRYQWQFTRGRCSESRTLCIVCERLLLTPLMFSYVHNAQFILKWILFSYFSSASIVWSCLGRASQWKPQISQDRILRRRPVSDATQKTWRKRWNRHLPSHVLQSRLNGVPANKGCYRRQICFNFS